MLIDHAKIQRRVHGMTDGELISWLEAAIPGMQRHLEQYVKTKNLDHLGELGIAEMTANMVVTELMVRKFPRDVDDDVAVPVPIAPYEPPTVSGTISAPRLFRRGRRAKTGTATVPSPDTE
jgi:hypothetical protein